MTRRASNEGKKTDVAARRRKVTDRQQKYVELLLVDPEMNTVRAAEGAGYKNPDVLGPRLRHLAHVAELIDEKVKERAARLEVKSDDVLRELLAVLKVDIGRAFGADGKILPMQPVTVKLENGKEEVLEMPEDVRRAVGGVDVTELFAGRDDERHQIGQVTKLRMLDKVRVIELAMKHLGMMKDTRVRVDGTVKLKAAAGVMLLPKEEPEEKPEPPPEQKEAKP